MSHKLTLTKNQSVTLVIISLAVLSLAIYWPVQKYEFTNYDDTIYVTQNYVTQQGISINNIIAAFTDISIGEWHPLTMISHMLDWQLFGDKAGGHHWTSVIIHIFNTALLFLFFHTITGAIWRSAFVAALFAFHPINVDSVAWIAERKNVLSTFFWILTMLFYVWYVRLPNWRRYLPVFFCFVLGLMSKPMLVTLPFVLLLLDYWPLNRTTISYQNEDQTTAAVLAVKKEKISFLILEKVPLFILSAVSIGLTLYAADSVNTISTLEEVPMMKRVANVIVSYGLYIKKMFWPVDLAVFYPFNFNIPFWHIILAASLIIIITICVCVYFRKFPYLFVGWFWYLGTLVPVIGIIKVGSQSMADRWAYVPFIGLFIMISWGMFGIMKKLVSAKIITMIVTVILVALMILTHFQGKYWRDTFTLFSHTLKVTENNSVAHYILGDELQKQNKIDEAMIHYQAAFLLHTDKSIPLVGMGRALSKQGKHEEAIAVFRQVIKIKPKSAAASDNLCRVLMKMGRVEDAIEEYRRVLKLINDNPGLYNNFGNVLVIKGNYDDAIRQYKEALRIRPADAGIYYNIGMVLIRQGKIDEALKHFQEAIILQPQYAHAHYQVAIILRQKGLLVEADYHFMEAIRINPEYKNMK